MKPLAMESGQRRLRQGSLAIRVVTALLFFVSSAHAQKDPLQEGDRVMETMGNAPTEFIARCAQGQHVVGFDLRTGKDISAIQPICATALAPAVAGTSVAYPSRFGGTGSGSERLLCPGDNPFVTKLRICMEEESSGWGDLNNHPEVINGIDLYCGLAAATPIRRLEGPAWVGVYRGADGRTGLRSLNAEGVVFGNSTCAEGLVAVGISGHAGTRLDSLGLICGEPTLAQGATVRAQGRIKLPAGTVADRRPLSICDSARAARARNSPAAPGLEAQCKVQGEQPPIDFDGLAIKGEAIASQDPLSVDLRNQQPEGPARLGFDIGMGVAEGQTAPGPGKQAIQNRLSPLEQRGFVFALAFSLDRNRNPELARIGAAVAAADPDTAAARAAQPDVLHRLGFDIATGIFGDPALGAQGNTATGPGSMGIRNALLAPSVQNGFDDGVAFHLRRSYAH